MFVALFVSPLIVIEPLLIIRRAAEIPTHLVQVPGRSVQRLIPSNFTRSLGLSVIVAVAASSGRHGRYLLQVLRFVDQLIHVTVTLSSDHIIPAHSWLL